MVVIRSETMAGTTRPKGIPRPVTPEWKRDVLDRMAKCNPPMTKADLARAADVSTSAITQLFQAKTKSSRIVPEIHRALGMAPPTTDRGVARDALLSRLLGGWADLSEEDRVNVVRIVESIRKST